MEGWASLDVGGRTVWVRGLALSHQTRSGREQREKREQARSTQTHVWIGFGVNSEVEPDAR